MSPERQSVGPAKEDQRDIVLLCNPRAGGRWKELATILDSPEAKYVRWIVTDSIKDIGPALASLGEETQLLCIYGGDGTIQRILDQMYSERRSRASGINEWSGPQLAFIGGGTMNVTASWCGYGRKPVRNFRNVVRAFKSGQLLTKEVPVLRVSQGGQERLGFTFGLGPIIRVLNEYENGGKGILSALGVVLGSSGAAVAWIPNRYKTLLDPMEAQVHCDGRQLPYDRYAGVFCNSTGRLHIGVEPFVKLRTRETFYYLAYAITKQEVALLLPLLIRGRLPVDPKSLMKPVTTWKQLGLSLFGAGVIPTDPRYINDIASTIVIQTSEELYTVDAEILRSTGESLEVNLGPTLRLAVSPTVDLPAAARIAAEVAGPGRRPRLDAVTQDAPVDSP